MRIYLLLVLGIMASSGALRSEAATIAPPLLDISRQCGAAGHRSSTAMSECIVAESEARADILQNWAKYSDASAEKCINLSRKAKRQPYTAMSRCLSVEVAQAASNPLPQPVSDTKPSAPATAEPKKDGSTGEFLHGLKSFFTSH